MQIAFYKSSNQLAVFLTDREAARLDPSGAGGFRAEVLATPIEGTFKIRVVPDDNGNPLNKLTSGWSRVSWTKNSTRQSGVNLLAPRSQAEPNSGSLAWGPDGELCCEISYRAVSSASLPALIVPGLAGGKIVNNTDDLGAVLAQMKAHGLKGRVTAITVEVN